MIKNYTSTVPPERSIAYIEKRLVKHGAKNIVKRYGASGELAEVWFTLEQKQNGREVPFKLPARVDKVREMLSGKVRKPRRGTMQKVVQQAERTAWKFLADWVDIQLGLVELGQVEFMEVFLPYVYDPAKQQTFFERIKESGFKLLPQGEVKE